MTGLTGVHRGMVKTYKHCLGRDLIGDGAPRVALRSARPLKTYLITVETNKESTRVGKARVCRK
jgi:hypothetical protein